MRSFGQQLPEPLVLFCQRLHIGLPLAANGFDHLVELRRHPFQVGALLAQNLFRVAERQSLLLHKDGKLLLGRCGHRLFSTDGCLWFQRANIDHKRLPGQ